MTGRDEGAPSGFPEWPPDAGMAVCSCGDEFPAAQLADHLRVIHPSLDIDIANAPIVDATGEGRDGGDVR